VELIRRAISNLLNNAYHHAGPNARVDLKAQMFDSNTVTITVSDNGPGIVPEIKERALEPFVKSPNSKEGSGLGLAIVRSVVNAHGSEVFINSEPGRGTEVFFRLKIATGPVQKSTIADAVPEQRPRAKKGATILVVDDDEDTLEFMTLLLQKHGYRAVTALSSEKALQVFRDSKIDMALIDMALPGMDGVDMCRIIKTTSGSRKIPVYMFTASADSASRKKAQYAGCDGYIVKPISVEQVIKNIERALA
jgi:CheY-like chemotaxis protein/anti-sigma regulatory factor (Ser/Thr protein kinase)